MKNINECFEDMQNITTYLKGEKVDEGLKDILKTIKEKFKQAFQYLKGIVAKIGTYFIPADTNGNLMNAISPLTAGAAYVDGFINKKSTFVKMDKEGAKITGCKTKFEDSVDLYGKGNSIDYWMRMLKENEEDKTELNKVLENYINEHKDDAIAEELINEVKLHTDDPEVKYNIVVDDDKLKEKIKMTIKSKNLTRLLIWGAPGIGKTAILMNVLREMRTDFPDYRLIVKTLSNETPDNFTLPKYVEINGSEMATDVPKTWLPVYKPSGDPFADEEMDTACGNGLLFIDELSRATPQVLNVILPLVNEGIFNGYKIGSGWTIICASNRADDEQSGQSTIGNALANRFRQVHYEPSVDTWRKWADQQNFISPLLLQWLSMPEKETMSGGKFYYMDPNEDSSRVNDTTIMCTPRAWTNAMKTLAEYHRTGTLEGFKIFDIPKEIIREALNECVPATAVDSFMAFLEVVEEIGDFDKAVHDVWNNGGKNFKLDKKNLNKITLPLAQLICTAHANSLPTKEEWENLCKWIISQNSDQLASYVLDVFCNVFAGTLEKDDRPILFLVQARINKFGKDSVKIAAIKEILYPLCNKWKTDFEDIPDYSEGLRELINKYGKSFKSAVVGDHIDALG